MIIILKNERPPSWNQLFKGNKLGSKEEIERIHDAVIAALIDMKIPVMSHKHIIEGKINIQLFAHFKDRPIDSDNIPAKIYIDALKWILIHDDTIKYVGKVTTESFVDYDNPRLEIHIMPYE